MTTWLTAVIKDESGQQPEELDFRHFQAEDPAGAAKQAASWYDIEHGQVLSGGAAIEVVVTQDSKTNVDTFRFKCVAERVMTFFTIPIPLIP